MSLLVGAYHNQWLTRVWAYIGGVAVVLGLAELVAQEDLKALDWPFLVALLALVVFSAFLKSLPRNSLFFRFDPGGWVIELRQGDLFDQDCAIVVTVDRRVSTSVEEVGRGSLISQLISRRFISEAALMEQLPREGRVHGKFPAGTLVPFISSEGQSAGFLFCLTNNTGGMRVDLDQLLSGHAALWDGIRRRRPDEVAVPIIGSGFAGSAISTRALLMFLLLSLHGASVEGRVAKRVRVIISEVDFDPRMFRAAQHVLRELGYSKVQA